MTSRYDLFHVSLSYDRLNQLVLAPSVFVPREEVSCSRGLNQFTLTMKYPENTDLCYVKPLKYIIRGETSEIYYQKNISFFPL